MKSFNRVDDDAVLWRLVLIRRCSVPNPKYDWRTCNETGESPYILSKDTRTEYYGPYKSQSAAKQQLTVHRTGISGGYREDIVGYEIQRAHIVWENVPVTLED